MGSVWPGKVNFPDFFNPNTSKWWGDQLDSLQKKLNFSGIWLDMNEPSNFIHGQVDLWQQNFGQIESYMDGVIWYSKSPEILNLKHAPSIEQKKSEG